LQEEAARFRSLFVFVRDGCLVGSDVDCGHMLTTNCITPWFQLLNSASDDIETVGSCCRGTCGDQTVDLEICNPSRTAVVRGDLDVASYESNEARDGKQHGYCARDLPAPGEMDIRRSIPKVIAQGLYSIYAK
jgi:hypothetical protein